MMVQSTPTELKRYKQYVADMEAHGMKARKLPEWLETYREAQKRKKSARRKKGGSRAKSKTANPA